MKHCNFVLEQMPQKQNRTPEDTTKLIHDSETEIYKAMWVGLKKKQNRIHLRTFLPTQ